MQQGRTRRGEKKINKRREGKNKKEPKEEEEEGEGDLIFDVEFPIQQIRSVEHLFDLFDNSGTPPASIQNEKVELI